MFEVRAAYAFSMTAAFVVLLLPPGVADHSYEQSTIMAWNTATLDVLVLGVDDPVVGRAIQDGIAAWQAGVAALAPEWLAGNLSLRVFFPAADPTPPAGFQAQDVEIYFVPQGFVSIASSPNLCVATAPLAYEYAYLGPDALYNVAAHEFGHCLGLGHVFNHGVEYEPMFDLMGGGRDRACPSNLNILTLERVYGPLFGFPGGGLISVPSSSYFQIDEC